MAADSRRMEISTPWPGSSQIRFARVDDLGIGEDVHQGRPPRPKARSSAGRSSSGSRTRIALAAKRFDHLVVAGLRPQLGRDRVAVEELHRVVLERPDPVVAHHPDHAEPVAGHRVELHPGEAESAVAEQQADLAVGVGDLGADRLARAGAEAPEQARGPSSSRAR